MRPTRVRFTQAPDSPFTQEFIQRFRTYGGWYTTITERQMAAARGIDAVSESYSVRERMTHALELVTRMMLLNRRAVGFGLATSIGLNVTLFWEVPFRLAQWVVPHHALLSTVMSIVVRIILLLVGEDIMTFLTMFSGWFQRGLEHIHQDAVAAFQTDPKGFQNDLVIISFIDKPNGATADYLLHHVCHNRSE